MVGLSEWNGFSVAGNWTRHNRRQLGQRRGVRFPESGDELLPQRYERSAPRNWQRADVQPRQLLQWWGRQRRTRSSDCTQGCCPLISFQRDERLIRRGAASGMENDYKVVHGVRRKRLSL